jgi:CheY-like chemotaxis protein
VERVTSDRRQLGLAVRQALRHLDDLLYLRSSLLVALLDLEEAVEGPGEALREALIDAVEAMRTPALAERDKPAWRRWHCLSMRYLQAAPPERILQEMGISARQMRRDHLEAVEDLASILWTRYRERLAAREETLLSSVSRSSAVPSVPMAVNAEVVRMGASPRREPVGLAKALESALSLVAKLADRHGTSFAVMIPEGVVPVAVNRGVLRQVLVALFSYAAEAISGGRIEIRGASGPHWVQLSLRARTSTGHLDPATVVDTCRLTISQQLISMQGGAIEWRMDDISGLSIDLQLPAAELATVLVIDDNPDFSELFERYLHNFGYRVIQAGDGQQAIYLARTTPPDIVALDLMIPDQDGWDILQQLQSHAETRDIPIVVCSALREEELALSLGATDFLAKPITQCVLLGALDRCRARRAERPGLASDSPSEFRPKAHQAG